LSVLEVYLKGGKNKIFKIFQEKIRYIKIFFNVTMTKLRIKMKCLKEMVKTG